MQEYSRILIEELREALQDLDDFFVWILSHLSGGASYQS